MTNPLEQNDFLSNNNDDFEIDDAQEGAFNFLGNNFILNDNFSHDEDPIPNNNTAAEQFFIIENHATETTPDIFVIDDHKLSQIFLYFLFKQIKMALPDTEMASMDLSQAITIDTSSNQLVQAIENFIRLSEGQKLRTLRHFVFEHSTHRFLQRCLHDFFHGNNTVLEITGNTFFNKIIQTAGVNSAAIILSALLNFVCTKPQLNELILSDIPTELLNHHLVSAAKQHLQEAGIQVYEATAKKIFTEADYASFFHSTETPSYISRFFSNNGRDTHPPQGNELTPI
jgi:hypothetical protein